MIPSATKSSGQMSKKKKKKRTELRVVKPSGEEAFPPLKDQDIWDVAKLTTKLRKARKRIKKLEKNLEDVTASNATLEEKHALLEKRIETLDTRTSRMGGALRQCMKQLGVERPE